MDKDLTPDFAICVNNTLLQLLSQGEISKKYFDYLSPIGQQGIRTAELYLLNKVHSDPPTKARPIISANGCPMERISEFDDLFLQPFVSEQHTFIKDTSDFIRKVELITVPDNALIITLDYESMYTNICSHRRNTANHPKPPQTTLNHPKPPQTIFAVRKHCQQRIDTTL